MGGGTKHLIMKLRDLSIIEAYLPAGLDFERALRESERLARSQGDVILMPLYFTIEQQPGEEQPAGCLLLKLLRLQGDRRACIVTFPKEQSKQASKDLAKDICSILRASGSHVMLDTELDAILAPKPIGVLAKQGFSGSLLSHVVEDLRMTDPHASLGLIGLKQACDALMLSGAQPGWMKAVYKEIRKSPERLFRIRYTTARTDHESQLQGAQAALHLEAAALGKLLVTLRGRMKGKQVLVVEDDVLWTDMLNHTLKEGRGPSPTEVIARGTDKAMCQRIASVLQDPKHRIALCVVDLRLRTTSGNKNTWRKVLQQIRRLDKGVPILVLSASRDAQDRQDAMALDADAFFTKHMDVGPLQVFTTHELERRSLRHMHALLTLMLHLTSPEMAHAVTWARELREAQVHGSKFWWQDYEFESKYQSKTGYIGTARHTVRLSDREVFGLFEESIVRYRRTLMGLSGNGALDDMTIRFQALVRANFITALGSLIERVHSRDPESTQKVSTEQLGTYLSIGEKPEPLGRGDHLAQHLYFMRHAASHYGGMVKCGDREWHAFFTGMFIWLLGLRDGAFPWFSEPAAYTERRAWSDPWGMEKAGDLSDKLMELISQDTDLHPLVARLQPIHE